MSLVNQLRELLDRPEEMLDFVTSVPVPFRSLFEIGRILSDFLIRQKSGFLLTMAMKLSCSELGYCGWPKQGKYSLRSKFRSKFKNFTDKGI